MALIHDNSYFLQKTRPPAEAPPPRRLRGFPLPLWRGVNGLANYSRTVVSVPRPPTTNICYHRELLVTVFYVFSLYIYRVAHRATALHSDKVGESLLS